MGGGGSVGRRPTTDGFTLSVVAVYRLTLMPSPPACYGWYAPFTGVGRLTLVASPSWPYWLLPMQ